MRNLSLLFLSLILFELAQAGYDQHLPKDSKNPGEIVHHNFYSLNYVEDHEQASWIIYDLNKAKLKPLVKRKNNFREDPYVSTYSASPSDYKNSGYDKGHMVPAGSMKFSKIAMSECFYMSNMSPQYHGLNRNTRRILEETIRIWAKKDDLVIVMGPMLERGLKKIKGNVSVPKFYYKIVYKKGEMIGFIMPNKTVTASFHKYAVSVDEIEKRTGIDFFPEMEDKQEQRLESKFDKSKWPKYH